MAAAEEESSIEELCFDVVAVLPAGGSGVRMNLELPKQFYQIMGRPLISHTLAAFESVSWIKEIVVPISENYLEVAQQVVSEFSHTKVRLICGGTTRHRSIWNGIQALTAEGRSRPTVVILHDAVRPFVDEQTLRSVTLAAKNHGAAGVIRPLASTIVAQSSDGFLDHSLDRSKFRSSEMPQAFQYDVIKKAYEQCSEYDFEHGTECLHLAQEYGETRAVLIDGPESLWKVTYKKDLYSVEGVLREKQAHTVLVVGEGFQNFLDKLNEQLRNRDVMVTFLPDMSMEQQDSPTVEQLASQISCSLRSCNHCVSVVFVVDDTNSDDKSSSKNCLPKNVRCFIQAISRRCNPCHVKGFRLVIVRFSSCRENFITFKLATEEMKSSVHEHSVVCFGVFAACPILNNHQGKVDVSKLIEKAAELTTGALFDVPSVFNGQTFNTIT